MMPGLGDFLLPPAIPSNPMTVGDTYWNPTTRQWERRQGSAGNPPVVSSTPTVEAAATQPPTLPGPPNESFAQKLWRNIRDPRVQLFMTAMGSSLAQPRPWGQTGVGAASNAINAGYGALWNASELQRQRDLEARKRAIEEAKAGADIELTQARTGEAKAGARKVEQEVEMAPAKFDWEKQMDLLDKANDAKTLEATMTNYRRQWMEADRQFNLTQQRDTETSDRNARLDRMAEAKNNAELAHLAAQTAELKARAVNGDPADQRAYVQLYNSVLNTQMTLMGQDPNMLQTPYAERLRRAEAMALRAVTAAGWKGGEINPTSVGPPASAGVSIGEIRESEIPTVAAKMGISEAEARRRAEETGLAIVSDTPAPAASTPAPTRAGTVPSAAPTSNRPAEPTTSFLEESGRSITARARATAGAVRDAKDLTEDGIKAIYALIGGRPDDPKYRAFWSFYSTEVRKKVKEWLDKQEQGYKNTLKPEI